MTLHFAGCCALVTALSSSTAAPVPKGAGTTIYFPITPGAKWVYEKVSGVDEVAVVSGVEKIGDDLVVARAGADGNETRYTKMVVSAEGLRQEREGANGESAWLLKSGLRSGDSWDVPDGGKRTVYGPEPIEVPAGKFTALRVVWEHEGGRLTSWYAPGVGEVKRVEKKPGGKETVTRLLKSFQVKEKK
ncbi:hypothetical protein VT84_27035 [Gemmata sp. SH-PL17]|uniref:hypothetical protein n=1 Tax=Gemmata sp. SH-PL17 TaxID=1630693 RepID=UPI0004B1004A|nr:hypothetical protein [Gemmata sp. SH-PL17]AMV28090.1 hypothetical protein VT84_27035 [Gemmata sp. SH-PL17]